MTCTGCNSNACQTLSEIQSSAETTSSANSAYPNWLPQEIAQNVLNIMSAMGIATSPMDNTMPLAAMNQQGCYQNPNNCYEEGSGYTTDCSSPVDGEGYGVLQETYFASQGSLSHASSALNEAQSNNAENVFFPYGINACTVVSDPGTVFAEFYFYAMGEPGTNCEAIGDWIGAPDCAVDCAECSYMEFNDLSSC